MADNNDGCKTQKIDPFSPYYLGSHDSPGNIITNVVFRGDNYEEWSRSIRLSLKAQRKYGFIEGTIPKPTDTTKLEDWYCVQSTLVQWILMTIDSSIKKTLPFLEEAKPLWDVLRRLFEVGNGPRRQQIKAALANCKQTKSMSVVEYFGLLQPLWDELATYNLPPMCKCGHCKCNLGELYQARADEDRLHKFLFGINTELYGNVRSSLLAQEPFSSLDRAYQAKLQKERLRSSSRARAKRDDVMTLDVKSQPPLSRSSRKHDGRDKSSIALYSL